MKKRISLLLTLVLVISLLPGCSGKSSAPANETPTKTEDTKTTATETPAQETEAENKESSDDDFDLTKEELVSGLHHVEIDVQNYGTIAVELDADTAPISVTNFLFLARHGFYDGLTFHRIIDGFMIQGGDPTGTGMGGSDWNIRGEFSQNGVANNISHVRGVISMARSQDPNSASSQFFIVQSDSTYLDGAYAGFGHVTSGMEYVDQICKDTPVRDNNGTVLPPQQPVITAIRVID